MTKTCYCGTEFEATRAWSKYCSTRCRDNNPTKRSSTKQFQDERRARINKIKTDTGCQECGYNAHPAALQFNHRNPLEKSFNISQDPKKAWDLIEAEIGKCDVLCANCHSIHTYVNNHNRPKAGI